MKLTFNGTAAAEGFPALFVNASIVKKLGSLVEKIYVQGLLA